MGLTTRALVAPRKGGPLEIRNVTLDEIRPDEAVVEIHAVGVCHADISSMTGKLPAQFPGVFGHEGAGIVRQIGSDVDGVQVGDHVALSYNYCGECAMCEGGHPAYCQHLVAMYFGGTRRDGTCTMKTETGSQLYGSFFGQSSFSNLAVVNKRCIVPVDANDPLHLYAPLGCSVQTGVGAILNTLDVQSGTSVAVFGTGSVGMAAIMGAKLRGASTIIGIDLDQGRLAIAKQLGATAVIHSPTQSVEEEIGRICHGGGVKYAVDTTGAASVVEQMVNCLGNLGEAVTIGAPEPDVVAKIRILQQLTKGLRYSGCNQGDSLPTQMIPYLIEQHKAGRLPIEKVVRTYEMENFAAALEDMRTGKTIKPVLLWSKAN